VKDGGEINDKPSRSINGVTVNIPDSNSVSDLSELEEQLNPENSDPEASKSELSQVFGDADFSPEVKCEEPYTLGQQGCSPLTLESGSVFNFGSTILSTADQQSIRSLLSSAHGVATEKRGYSSTCSLENQSCSKIRSYFSALTFSQGESFSQSNVTCIKMASSQGSISESFLNPQFDTLNPLKSEKNMEMQSQTASSIGELKEQDLSQKLCEARENQLKLTAKVATLEEDLRRKDSLLKKKSQTLKKCEAKLAKYKSIPKNTTQHQAPSADTEVVSIDIKSIPEESLDDRVRKLKEQLGRKNAQLSSDKDNISSLQTKYDKQSQAIVKLINRIEQLRKKLIVREDLIATYSERTSERSEGNILGALGTMENGLDKLFECFKTYSLDLGKMLQELQRRTVNLKYYVAESSSDGFFQQYSLKSIPIKNCITAISKNFSKHHEEMNKFYRNFKSAVSVICRWHGQRAPFGQRANSPESKSSRVLSNSLHYHLQRSSLSSIEILSPRPRSSSSLHQKKQP